VQRNRPEEHFLGGSREKEALDARLLQLSSGNIHEIDMFHKGVAKNRVDRGSFNLNLYSTEEMRKLLHDAGFGDVQANAGVAGKWL
jgi:putative component of toxin-antitoxin plasmid stabilization module